MNSKLWEFPEPNAGVAAPASATPEGNRTLPLVPAAAKSRFTWSPVAFTVFSNTVPAKAGSTCATTVNPPLWPGVEFPEIRLELLSRAAAWITPGGCATDRAQTRGQNIADQDAGRQCAKSPVSFTTWLLKVTFDPAFAPPTGT